MTGASLSLDWLQAALGIIVITDLSLLGAERQRLCIRLIAVQGILLGLLPLLAHRGAVDAHLIAVTCVFLGIKGVVMPRILYHTYRKLPPQAPVRPFLGHTACVFLGLAGLVFSLWLGGRLGIAANPLFSQMFAPAFATVFTGLLLIVTRAKALTQMFGYLVMENGIYLLGVPMAQEDAVWLELSVLLDVLVGAFVMGIAILHIHRAFSSTEVGRFSTLRD